MLPVGLSSELAWDRCHFASYPLDCYFTQRPLPMCLRPDWHFTPLWVKGMDSWDLSGTWFDPNLYFSWVTGSGFHPRSLC